MIKLIEKITGKPRYRPEVKFDGSVIYFLFRCWEYVFGREVGVRIEKTTTNFQDSDGNWHAVKRFYTLESVLVFCESYTREYINNLIKKIPSFEFYIPTTLQPSFAYEGFWTEPSTNERPKGYVFAIAYVTSTGNNGDGSSPQTFSETISGSNPAIFSNQGYSYSVATPTLTSSTTYNSVAMTRVASYAKCTASFAGTTQFVAFTPASGSHNISATNSVSSGTFTLTLITGVYSGVKPTAVDSSNSVADLPDSTSITASTTVVASNCWLVGCFFQGAGDASAGAGTTLRVDQASTQLADSGGTVSTGSQSLVLNYSSASGAYVICSIEPQIDYPLSITTVAYTLTYQNILFILLYRLAVDTASFVVTFSTFTFSAISGWLNTALNTSVMTNETKNSSSWSNETKDSSTFTNETKN